MWREKSIQKSRLVSVSMMGSGVSEVLSILEGEGVVEGAGVLQGASVLQGEVVS